MDYNYIEMGNRIKLRRQELKIKQYELASSINISDNHISSIERGCEIYRNLRIFKGISRLSRSWGNASP